MISRLGTNPIPFQLPIGAENEFEGVIDLLTQKALYWDEEDRGVTYREDEIPAHLAEAAAAARETMMDAMVREMTLEEIRALADFYEQPIAKSAMRKSSLILSELMPVIRREAQRAAQAAFEAQQAESGESTN